MTKSEKTIEIIKSLQLQCDVTGKINGLSFYKWKGNNVYRRIGKPSTPPSPVQLECRRKFAILQNLSKIFKPIIRDTYNTGKKPLTPANLFIKRNGKIFEKGEKDSVSLPLVTKLNSNCSWFDSAHQADSSNNDKLDYNPEQIKQTHSEQEGNSLPERSRRENNVELSIDYSKLKLTRSNHPIPFTSKLTKHSEELFTLKWDDFTKRYDTIALIIFSPEKGKYHNTEINITETHWHIEIPQEFQNTNNYYYLYCYHSKRKTYSESITLTPEDGADILWKIHGQKLSLTMGFNPWLRPTQERDILRFNLWFPFGCLLPSFDITSYWLKQKNLAISSKRDQLTLLKSKYTLMSPFPLIFTVPRSSKLNLLFNNS
ncbi:MAG: hypothetical protein KDK36_12500 [Leptospiraceae bacterium]|nr:hypothetical protein [Leptospiraceae bacterium]